jgi:hypothetical protein
LELAAQRRLDALNALTNPSLLSQVPRWPSEFTCSIGYRLCEFIWFVSS